MRRAQSERIPCETSGTYANGIMIFRGTLCPQSTGIRARIRAFLIYTRQMRRTLGVNDALRSARRRNASVLR